MALDQSALLEVLDALRNADAADRITQAAETIYQALIDAELTALIGAARCSSKPMTNGRSPTNATCRKPPWPYSTNPATQPSTTLQPTTHSRHSWKP
jgi:hypothetical protein